MRQQFIFVLTLFLQISILSAQNLVSSESLGSLSKAEVSTLAGGVIQATNGVDMYKILYTTPDVQGVLDTASGLVLIPNIEGTFPMLVFQHGTVGSPEDVPSNLMGGYQLPVVFGGFSYISIAPDYLGLGEARGFHPYVHAATEASAAIDMIFATQQLVEQLEATTLNEQLFLTGYSQGGHAAMALHRELEANYSDVLPVTAAAPMSGPYSISGPMRDLILTEQEYFFTAYIPYTALSYQEAYGNIFDEVADFFKQPYATEIERFYQREIDLGTLNETLIQLLIAEHGASLPSRMIHDDVLENIMNDEQHPVNVALRANDVYDWSPEAPTRIYYCTADDQVPFQNSIIAETTMNENGANDVEAFDVSPNSDHGGCVVPATTAALFFFFNFQSVMTAHETLANDLGVHIYPNPATDELFIDCATCPVSTSLIEVVNIHGQSFFSKTLSGTDVQRLNVGHLPSGIYLIKGRTEEGVWLRKWMKR